MMKNEDRTPEIIDLQDWEQSGEGSWGVTYFHKSDDTLLLKLNSEDMPQEENLKEFNFTNAVHLLGVKCPAALRLVSDGHRFGYISERLAGKKSFARIISEDPAMIEPLAKDFAAAARYLHSIPCDTGVFESITERFRTQINSCRWIKKRTKALLNSYADGLRPITTCLHGDMHPGNYLRADKGDYWIDLGRFGYGDPDLDYASQYVLANLAPEYMTKWLLHIDHATYGRFLELYGQYHYGEDFHSAETQERLRRVICFYLGHAMTKSPAAGMIYGFYVRGREKTTRILVGI
ncbi:MAG: phosphotransferase, partial [Bacteroidia bacterium]|nr:phosphotransferase [Bacteroidia bacterium]